jgi:rubredoxin-NAD+ reductase
MPVLVKTPAIPTVVAPPAPGQVGEWTVSVTADGLEALFKAADDSLKGFALLGNATARKQALTPQLPTQL